jgi:hypothetical protein
MNQPSLIVKRWKRNSCWKRMFVQKLLRTTDIFFQKMQDKMIQNGNWDKDADWVSSGNQGPCWDAETHLVKVKNKGELKLQHPKPLAHVSLLHITIHWKNRQSTTPTPLPLHLHPIQEGSSTTRHQLQTCLEDTDKRDWMLKE